MGHFIGILCVKDDYIKWICFLNRRCIDKVWQSERKCLFLTHTSWEGILYVNDAVKIDCYLWGTDVNQIVSCGDTAFIFDWKLGRKCDLDLSGRVEYIRWSHRKCVWNCHFIDCWFVGPCEDVFETASRSRESYSSRSLLDCEASRILDLVSKGARCACLARVVHRAHFDVDVGIGWDIFKVELLNSKCPCRFAPIKGYCWV